MTNQIIPYEGGAYGHSLSGFDVEFGPGVRNDSIAEATPVVGLDTSVDLALLSSVSAAEVYAAQVPRLGNLVRLRPGAAGIAFSPLVDHDRPVTAGPIELEAFERLAEFKIKTAEIAMHLEREWRSRLFGQLDRLLEVEDWDPRDLLPTGESFATLIRVLLALRPGRRPGLGATSDGHFVAMWTVDEDRLSLECFSDDQIRWTLSRMRDGEPETGTGRTSLHRLRQVLAPYEPAWWLEVNGNGVRSERR